MILYATKQTFERYKLKLPQELSFPAGEMVQALIQRESGDRLLEWGAKLFYFDGRKSVQVVNFASKFTLFLMDVKMADVTNLGNMISFYLFELYKNDQQMTKALAKMCQQSPTICFAKLTDKSAIATLNTTQTRFADDGYRFYEFLENGILKTMDINRIINFKYLFTMTVGGKVDYIYAGEKFRELLLARYGVG